MDRFDQSSIAGISTGDLSSFWIKATDIHGRCGFIFDIRTHQFVNKPLVLRESRKYISLKKPTVFWFSDTLNDEDEKKTNENYKFRLSSQNSQINSRFWVKPDNDDPQTIFIHYYYQTRMESLSESSQAAEYYLSRNEFDDLDHRATHIVVEIEWGLQAQLTVRPTLRNESQESNEQIYAFMERICSELRFGNINILFSEEDEQQWKMLNIQLEELSSTIRLDQDDSRADTLAKIKSWQNKCFDYHYPQAYFLRPIRWLTNPKPLTIQISHVESNSPEYKNFIAIRTELEETFNRLKQALKSVDAINQELQNAFKTPETDVNISKYFHDKRSSIQAVQFLSRDLNRKTESAEQLIKNISNQSNQTKVQLDLKDLIKASEKLIQKANAATSLSDLENGKLDRSISEISVKQENSLEIASEFDDNSSIKSGNISIVDEKESNHIDYNQSVRSRSSTLTLSENETITKSRNTEGMDELTINSLNQRPRSSSNTTQGSSIDSSDKDGSLNGEKVNFDTEKHDSSQCIPNFIDSEYQELREPKPGDHLGSPSKSLTNHSFSTESTTTYEESVSQGPKESSSGKSDEIEEENAEITQPNDINILLVGETGVGKSTFINAFANYIHFDDLNAACEDPVVVMPVSFLTTVGNEFTQKIVTFGELDPNESFDKPGQSVTQECRSYVFNIGNTIRLRIIDTPGIGDIRGVEQDIINIDNIISYVLPFKYIHGVCILLKPGMARDQIMFRYCLKQIFNYLSSHLLENVAWCFTNTRPQFFTPGDTGPTLKNFLKAQNLDLPIFVKDNAFTFDSESFQYLMCVRQSIEFDDNHEQQYIKSWSRSVTESIRLFNWLCKLNRCPLDQWRSKKHAERKIKMLIDPLMMAWERFLHAELLIDHTTSPTKLDSRNRLEIEGDNLPSKRLRLENDETSSNSRIVASEFSDRIWTMGRYLENIKPFIERIDTFIRKELDSKEAKDSSTVEIIKQIMTNVKQRLEKNEKKEKIDDEISIGSIYETIEWAERIPEVKKHMDDIQKQNKLNVKNSEKIVKQPMQKSGLTSRLQEEMLLAPHTSSF